MDISGKIEANQVAVYRDVSNAAEALDIPFVVVGAAARDLVLHYGYGAKIVRATVDIDFGVQIPDAAAYKSMLARLVTNRYRLTAAPHRLISPNDIVVDLVPFGPIATADGNVILPPDESHQINIVGFQEACDSADQVTIQTNPQIVIPVASPAGLALLKLIAWTDRAADIRRKDASDLAYLLENYEKIPMITEIIYDDTAVLEGFDWDPALAGAFVLGSASKAIASEEALTIVAKLKSGKVRNRTIETLQYEMCRYNFDDDEVRRKHALLDAFFQGFSIQQK